MQFHQSQKNEWPKFCLMRTPNVWGRTRRKVGSMRIEIGKILQTSFISAQIQTLFVVSNKLLRIVKMLHKLVFQLRGIRRHYRKYDIGLVGKHDLTIQSDLYYLRPSTADNRGLTVYGRKYAGVMKLKG